MIGLLRQTVLPRQLKRECAHGTAGSIPSDASARGDYKQLIVGMDKIVEGLVHRQNVVPSHKNPLKGE
jgi:hypothetical protein